MFASSALSLLALSAAASVDASRDLHHGHHKAMIEKRTSTAGAGVPLFTDPTPYGGYTSQEKSDWVQCPGDHMNWENRNAPQWWQTDPTQQDHVRYHCLLSMAAYGDYETECPKVFVNSEGTDLPPWTVNEKFSVEGNPVGQSGFVATIPEMNKVVLVFQGNSMDGLDWTMESIDDIVKDCDGCMAASAVVTLYNLAKSATNDFAAFKDALEKTKLLSSSTGHGVGAAVATLAAMDLGARGWMQYAHNQGMPRAFNHAAIVRFDKIFEGEAGQSIVSLNDPIPLQVKTSTGYCHVGTKIHITGNIDQWLTNCYGWAENATCLGTGTGAMTDHTYYFTELGSCGSVNKGF